MHGHRGLPCLPPKQALFLLVLRADLHPRPIRIAAAVPSASIASSRRGEGFGAERNGQKGVLDGTILDVWISIGIP